VQLRAEYNQALQQAEINRVKAEKQKQANIVYTDEYKFLQHCIALADKYQVRDILFDFIPMDDCSFFFVQDETLF